MMSTVLWNIDSLKTETARKSEKPVQITHHHGIMSQENITSTPTLFISTYFQRCQNYLMTQTKVVFRASVVQRLRAGL
jgi:hypothetical protein